MADNLQRMLKLVNEFFDTRNDPEQLDVDDKIIARLKQMHPATLSELRDENGPYVWILIIPTQQQIMERFLSGELTETQLYEQTPLNASYDALYLCSASVLPEYRYKGLAKKATLDAINAIRENHPIKSLFYWPFSNEGRMLAAAVARAAALPLYERKAH
jgi:hypothetical protein